MYGDVGEFEANSMKSQRPALTRRTAEPPMLHRLDLYAPYSRSLESAIFQ